MDKAAIHLDDVRVEHLHQPQGGIACAEIVNGRFEAHLFELNDLHPGGFRIFHNGAFGYFHFQQGVGHVVAGGNFSQLLGKILSVKVQLGKIAGDDVRGQVAQLPTAQRFADFFKNVQINAGNQPVAFKKGNKAARHEQTAGRMVPAHQGFCADNAARAHIHLGLEPGRQFAVAQRRFQPAVQLLMQQGLLAHLFVIAHKPRVGGAFGFMAGVVGQVQHALHVLVLVGKHLIGAVDGADFIGQLL